MPAQFSATPKATAIATLAQAGIETVRAIASSDTNAVMHRHIQAITIAAMMAFTRAFSLETLRVKKKATNITKVTTKTVIICLSMVLPFLRDKFAKEEY